MIKILNFIKGNIIWWRKSWKFNRNIRCRKFRPWNSTIKLKLWNLIYKSMISCPSGKLWNSIRIKIRNCKPSSTTRKVNSTKARWEILSRDLECQLSRWAISSRPKISSIICIWPSRKMIKLSSSYKVRREVKKMVSRKLLLSYKEIFRKQDRNTQDSRTREISKGL